MSGAERFIAPIETTLVSAGFDGVRVTSMASVGASRATLFIDAQTGDETTACVAQVGSSDATLQATEEAQLLRLAGAAGVAVPRVVAAADDVGADKVGVLITTAVEGLSIPREILRSFAGEEAGDQLAMECGESLARLHAVDLDAVPETIERLDPADPHRDYCRSLSELLDELPTHHPAIRWGINWLRRHPPSRPPSLALVHADFRNGNMLVADGHLSAILDWELAHVGDAMEDLAWMCVRMWRFGNDARPCGGFGSLDALRQGYVAAGGVWREDAFQWWLAARSAWWAITLARQGAAFLAGVSNSIVHAASGRRVPELEYDLLTLIRSQEN